MFKRAFTMIELVFVIVVMGILGKFGSEFLFRAYENFFFSTLQNRLQQQSEAAVTQIASRLQYRIKSSVVQSAAGTQIDWVGMDIEGWRGTWNGTKNVPTWSGFINLDQSVNPDVNLLKTPQTDLTKTANIIEALSYGDKHLSNSAIIFTGASNPTATIWDGNSSSQLGELAHRIQTSGNNFAPKAGTGTFSGVDIYEFYKLAWTAYTIRLEGNDLKLYYDYQPWRGEDYTNGISVKSSLLMENVQSFQYQTIGDLIKIQVCVNDNNLSGGFSVCKEKTVF